MGIAIKMEDELKKLNGNLLFIKDTAILNASKTALRKSMNTLQTVWNKRIRKELNVPAREIKRKSALVKRLRGNRLDALSTTVGFPDEKRGPGLINFVKGAKRPRKQKGVKVKNRKVIKTEVIPGRIITQKKRTFIAKGRGGKFHVFRRDKENDKMILQRGPRIHFYAKKMRVVKPVQRLIGIRLQREMRQQLKHQLMKMR